MIKKKLVHPKFALFAFFFSCTSACGQGNQLNGNSLKLNRSKLQCFPSEIPRAQGTKGSAQVFKGDPFMSAYHTLGAATSITPKSDLSRYTHMQELERLTGQGLLSGQHVNVTNDQKCPEDFSTYSTGQAFHFLPQDPEFSEAMAYYYGDFFFEDIMALGYDSARKRPVQIKTYCQHSQHATYYWKSNYAPGRDNAGQPAWSEKVCLSAKSANHNFAHDPAVLFHELSHGLILHQLYDFIEIPPFEANLDYNESKIIQEALCDWFALITLDPFYPENSELDPKEFSRWGLGQLIQEKATLRSAHRCPSWDPSFPKCDHFPLSNHQHLSLTYPMGLNFPTGTKGLDKSQTLTQLLLSLQNPYFSTSILVSALWDCFEILKTYLEPNLARKIAKVWILESLRKVPPPTDEEPFPLDHLTFGKILQDQSQRIFLSLAKPESTRILEEIQKQLFFHGLIPFTSVPPSELTLDTEQPIYFENQLKFILPWLKKRLSGLQNFPQSNKKAEANRLNAGQYGVLWLNFKNNSNQILSNLKIRLQSNETFHFLPPNVNPGFISLTPFPALWTVYSKIFGTYAPLQDDTPDFFNSNHLNTFFQSLPLFKLSDSSGIWIQINPKATFLKLEGTVKASQMTQSAHFSLEIPVEKE